MWDQLEAFGKKIGLCGGEGTGPGRPMERVMFMAFLVILCLALFSAVIFRLGRMEERINAVLDGNAVQVEQLAEGMDRLEAALLSNQEALQAMATHLETYQQKLGRDAAADESIRHLTGVLDKELQRNAELLRNLLAPKGEGEALPEN
jgi:Skp family chaperone for outer membrane proteins